MVLVAIGDALEYTLIISVHGEACGRRTLFSYNQHLLLLWYTCMPWNYSMTEQDTFCVLDWSATAVSPSRLSLSLSLTSACFNAWDKLRPTECGSWHCY